MITGLAAVAAAYFSIRASHNQQRSSENQEAYRRKAKVESLRIRLPLSLSDLIEYSNEIIKYLKYKIDYLENSNNSELENLNNFSKPPLPESAILIFADIVENTENQAFATYLANTVREIQILNSRLKGVLSGDSGTIFMSKDIEAYVIQAAQIHAYAAGLFEFARGTAIHPPTKIDWGLVHSALNLNDMWNSDYHEIHDWIGRMEEREKAALQSRIVH